jgi:hypothetical protein
MKVFKMAKAAARRKKKRKAATTSNDGNNSSGSGTSGNGYAAISSSKDKVPSNDDTAVWSWADHGDAFRQLAHTITLYTYGGAIVGNRAFCQVPILLVPFFFQY